MDEYKITGYVKIGFSKVVKCESYVDAMEKAEEISQNEDIDFSELNDWYDEVEVEETEEL
nr:MAG TPA: hypothetical protein [Caudoviricetes sp.]